MEYKKLKNKIYCYTITITMDNKTNIRITKEDVESILNTYSNIGDNNTYLHINDVNIYQQAFVHESYYQSVKTSMNDNIYTELSFNYIPTDSNESLEFLGDNIIKAVLGKYLFQRFPKQREGFLTQIKIRLEKTYTLHKFAEKLGFKKFLLLSPQTESHTYLGENRGRDTHTYSEDAFEAFIGALVIDFGEKGLIYADRFLINIIENIIDFSDIIHTNDNYKDILQRYFQSINLKNPIYETIEDKNKNNFIRVVVLTKPQLSVFDNNVITKLSNFNSVLRSHYKNAFDEKVIIGIGNGTKIVKADQSCAKMCLENLNISEFF